MNTNELIDDFLKDFKPKQDQSWKSCYFFAHSLKKKYDIAVQLKEGISRINKADYWVVSFDNIDEDIHAKAMGETLDFIDKPDVIWSLEEFEKDNF